MHVERNEQLSFSSSSIGGGQAEQVPLIVVIALGAALGVVAIGALVFCIFIGIKRKRAGRTPTKSVVKKTCRSRCFPCPCRRGKTIGFVTQTSDIDKDKESERQGLQAEVENSGLNMSEREKTRQQLENQGQNDSFFAGENYNDGENPNVDMNCGKIVQKAPNPDFVMQQQTDVFEETQQDCNGQDDKNLGKKAGIDFATELIERNRISKGSRSRSTTPADSQNPKDAFARKNSLLKKPEQYVRTIQDANDTKGVKWADQGHDRKETEDV